jgi:hypothetical protein
VPIFGSKVRVRAAINKTPDAGTNVDLKVYWTNLAHTELIHRFVGFCRMNNFTVGVLNNCDLPLPTQSWRPVVSHVASVAGRVRSAKVSGDRARTCAHRA